MLSLLNFPSKSHRLEFYKPTKSTELAEFCGIMLGDGGISSYQAAITLHAKDDFEYSEFIIQLIEKLFGIEPGIHKNRSNSVDIVISRVGLVEFLIEECGLVQGNKVKQTVDIPEWIKENSEYSIACLRGLVDTDGSIFNHRYVSKKKYYTYKKLSFTSVSEPLLNSVLEICKELGLSARIGSAFDVRLDSKADMESYFRLIGTNNPKHLNRYLS